MFPLSMDNDFLENAVRQIIECRRFLKWSYAFAYFANWKPSLQSKLLFEDHQGKKKGGGADDNTRVVGGKGPKVESGIKKKREYIINNSVGIQVEY